MKSPARRIALLTMAAGSLVVAGLVAFNWQVVRDHAEAWWFQATRETEMVVPGGTTIDLLFSPLASCAKRPVVFAPHDARSSDQLFEQAALDNPSFWEKKS
jgi:hypothetical protein